MSQIERLPGLFVKVPIIFLFMFLLAPVFGQQRFGEIGDLELVSGEVLRECSVGYRTFGQIDAIRNDRRWNNGDYTENPARAFEYEVGALILTHRNTSTRIQPANRCSPKSLNRRIITAVRTRTTRSARRKQ